MKKREKSDESHHHSADGGSHRCLFCHFLCGGSIVESRKRVDCYECRRVANKINKIRAYRTAYDKAFVSAKAKKIATVQTIKLKYIKADNLKTETFRDSKQGFRNIIEHCQSYVRLQAAMSLRMKIKRLKFVKFSPLGEGKDLSDERDLKNVQKKQRGGVIGYNTYIFKYKGREFYVKMEENSQGHETTYWLKEKE